MDDDPANTIDRDRQGVKLLADEILEIQAEIDFQQVIVESYDTAPGNPRRYSEDKKQAVRQLEASKKHIEEKKDEKRRLEERMRTVRKPARNTASSASGVGSNSDMDFIDDWGWRTDWRQAVECSRAAVNRIEL
ncbi:hypothetical protein CCHL11_07766 [Colletotrichum chlorophyti]|uniref:Uncharacterized protein n=1 Tax=Colletotrichum chlorophyti TaxID=708187 RepID=A0A1Q8RN17_9PEZI|nr:hypothetical protein CCHL11_07766 [Colletotrichum chlorophyti]